MAKKSKPPERKPFIVSINEADKSLLVHAGCTGMVFVQRPIDLNEGCTIIEATTITGRPKIVKRDKQLDQFETLMKSPLAAPYTLCINSAGNDIRAKYVAAFALRRAIEVYNKDRYHSLNESPAWHTLTGSYADWRRDKCYELRRKPKPAMIVFSNITADSSEVKLEKLRDLLEQYADVPRVVAITGMDPHSFFAHKLRYKLNAGLNLTRGSEVDPYRRRGQPPKKKVVPEEDEAPAKSTTKPAKRQGVSHRTDEI